MVTNEYRFYNRCIDRLLTEWEKYNNIIIAVDFDDTIFDYHGIKNDCSDVISLLRNVQNDATIFCHTASSHNRYDEIRKHFKDLDIELYGINKSPVKLHEFTDTKPYANIYIDDRAGLDTSMNILSTAYRLYKQLKED